MDRVLVEGVSVELEMHVPHDREEEIMRRRLVVIVPNFPAVRGGFLQTLCILEHRLRVAEVVLL